ncbi:hypothetical protein I4J11_09610 [Corynebacterium diphtheriae bv. mitis]|nr:hypothetical protein CDC7B_2110 [Corynebacterium diphtheriae C7 (beta)]AEX73014.1 hypothetical protein CDCE8392_2031 [Corynebacterium diphtheriae CDCE 8392]ERA50258.1 acetyl-CoA acetyltransferase [Corynebacterium diphtheriae DSM 43988]MBG9221603.1 hypothetical protein [Corynebacterium diphtheriae bv. mitis]MBG9246995.1 hypothetical protein [Corynebacterium diphtheriae bv. mitis]
MAVLSHARAAKAWSEGSFDRSVVPVKDANGLTILDRDETSAKVSPPSRWPACALSSP